MTYLTSRQAAALLGVSTEAIRQWQFRDRWPVRTVALSPRFAVHDAVGVIAFAVRRHIARINQP
jgi:hypothetical protein